ncbi:MAG: flagellar hook-associated protein FlgK [Halieaceae bacterium]|nr:flagellar hook-associated protein FlgK [Halieaceae bacterium]
MADLFGIGTSALRAAQLALDTTGNNIANVNTEGYSRQRVNLETLPPQGSGSRFVGSGVNVASIERTYSQFIEGEMLRYGSSSARYSAFSGISARLDQTMGSTGSAMSQAVDAVFSALQDVANNPTGAPERQFVLGETQSLVARQQSLYSAMDSLNLEVNARISSTVGEINSLTSGIARLNERIAAASAGGGSPNDLLDQRDTLVRRLADKAGVTVNEQQDGAINIFLGGGQALVVGSRAERLTTTPDSYDASRLNVAVDGVSGSVTVNGFINSGELRGLLDVREDVLDTAIDQLGLLSAGIADTVNRQNGLGTDLAGNLGGDLFATVNVPVLGNTNNAGTAAPAVTITDVGDLQADRYRLDFNAGSWTLTRLSDAQSVSGAGPLNLDGFSVDVSAGAPANGDSFLIQPARAAAEQFAALNVDPDSIAAAAPLVLESSLANTGSLAIGDLQVTDAVDLPLAGPVTLTFNPDALGPGIPGFDVTGGITTTVAYDPAVDASGATLTLGLTGVSFTVSGIPVAGDTATVTNTAAGSGDNSNALELANLRSDTLLEGGSSSYQDVYSSLLSTVAVQTSQANANAEVEQALFDQVEASRQSVSGVNLDEEAANLLRYQQQYQAAAKIISTADLVFSTLLNATRR